VAAAFRRVSVVFAIGAVALMAASLGCDDGERRGTAPTDAAGRLIGVVGDDQDSLPEGESPQSYASAKISVLQAIEAGTYRVSADTPVQVSYQEGAVVVEVSTDANGAYVIDLEPGVYFVQAFYGDRSYSEDLLVEIDEGETTELVLELIHGV